MIYNHLPNAIKDLTGNENRFKLALKEYLLDNSFYSLKEYFDASLCPILVSIKLLLRLSQIIEYNYTISTITPDSLVNQSVAFLL
jgi:hypothetical protein